MNTLRHPVNTLQTPFKPYSEGLLAELAAVQCLAAESPKGGDEFEGFSGGYGYGGRRSLDAGRAW